jgi:hypothetical protein
LEDSVSGNELAKLAVFCGFLQEARDNPIGSTNFVFFSSSYNKFQGAVRAGPFGGNPIGSDFRGCDFLICSQLHRQFTGKRY